MGGLWSTAEAAAETTMLVLRSCKMVLVVRGDLGMGKGKIAAQCAHAAVDAYKAAAGGSARAKRALSVWETTGCTKIALKAGSQAELLALAAAARERGIVASLIRDAGHTQVDPGTLTVLAIGPDDAAAIDAITGHLKLL